LESVALMIPALMATSLILSVVFLVVTWGMPSFGLLAALLSAINAIHLYATVRAAGTRSDQSIKRASTLVVGLGLVVGCLWAVVLSVLPVQQDMAIRTVALLGAGGLLCISLIALINYPQALAALTIPIVVGSLRGLTGLGQSGDILVQGTLIGGFTFILVTVVFNHASAFVALRASEMLVEEKGQIIGLLLREFEQTASDWVWGVDQAGTVNRVSGGFTKATGAAEEELIGADLMLFLRHITAPADPMVRQIEQAMAARETFQDAEIQIVGSGRECWWRLTGKPAFDDEGRYLGYLGTGADISERKIAERRITLLAHHDSLTGLLNRTRFTEQLSLNVARLDRYGTPFTVMFFDLDQFKGVNDSKGHMAGDRLLVEVAARMQTLLSEIDIAARFGGDEFAILLPDTGATNGAGDLFRDQCSAFGDKIGIDDFQIGLSAGIDQAIDAQDAADVEIGRGHGAKVEGHVVGHQANALYVYGAGLAVHHVAEHDACQRDRGFLGAIVGLRRDADDDLGDRDAAGIECRQVFGMPRDIATEDIGQVFIGHTRIDGIDAGDCDGIIDIHLRGGWFDLFLGHDRRGG
jgi:PAS domain S-box-containing protein